MVATFIGHKKFLWMWISLLGLIGLSVVYVVDDPIGGRNGGTTLGISYGILGACGIAFLMWYGIRKRYTYRRARFPLKSWLSPHVWLGVSLALIIPLHFGFKLNLTLHSLCYLLVLLTIASGIWGAVAFLRFPPQMRARREGITIASSIEAIESADKAMTASCKGKSEAFKKIAATFTAPLKPSFFGVLLGRQFSAGSRAELSALLSALPENEYQAGLELTQLAAERLDTANKMMAEASTLARMRIWLYVHVPLSLICVLAVAAHILWVLYYRGVMR